MLFPDFLKGSVEELWGYLSPCFTPHATEMCRVLLKSVMSVECPERSSCISLQCLNGGGLGGLHWPLCCQKLFWSPQRPAPVLSCILCSIQKLVEDVDVTDPYFDRNPACSLGCCLSNFLDRWLRWLWGRFCIWLREGRLVSSSWEALCFLNKIIFFFIPSTALICRAPSCTCWNTLQVLSTGLGHRPLVIPSLFHVCQGPCHSLLIQLCLLVQLVLVLC